MIDVIKSYSSSHGGRLQFNNTSRSGSLYKTLAKDSDVFLRSSSTKQKGINSFLVVGGGAAAISMIIETLFSSGELLKGNFSMIGEILRHAGIMGAIGGISLGIFTLFEKKVLNKIC